MAKKITKSREETYIEQQLKIFNKKLTDQVKLIHVPAFQVMHKNITIESYFLNHLEYEIILGKNVKLLDRMVLNIICDFITERITDDMKNGYFIGIWDKYTVYSVASTVATIMNNDTSTEKYLTSLQYEQISNEDLAKLQTGLYMPYSEYNPIKFMQIVSQIMAVTTETISNIMVKGVPHALISPEGKSSTVPMFIFKRFFDFVRTEITEIPYNNTDPAYEQVIMKFSDIIESPMMRYIVSELSKSGLSDAVITMFLTACKLHIIYTIPDNIKLGDVIYLFNMVSVDDRFDNISSGFQITAKDLINIIKADSIDDISKTRKQSIGSELRKMIISFTAAVISVYISTLAANNEDKKADLNE